jgi:hypothetical protein
MRYAGDTFDLLDGNNASIHYCAELNIRQVHANRIIEEHETVGIYFGEEYWRRSRTQSPRAMTLNQMLNQKTRIPLTFHRNEVNGPTSTSPNHTS